MVSYLPFNTVDTDHSCSICLENLRNESDVVSHSNGGDNHPMHAVCIKKWLESHDQCPFCRQNCQKDSLFSVTEKRVMELRSIKNDAVRGGFLGLAGAVSAVGLASLSNSGLSVEGLIIVTVAGVAGSILESIVASVAPGPVRVGTMMTAIGLGFVAAKNGIQAAVGAAVVAGSVMDVGYGILQRRGLI